MMAGMMAGMMAVMMVGMMVGIFECLNLQHVRYVRFCGVVFTCFHQFPKTLDMSDVSIDTCVGGFLLLHLPGHQVERTKK